MRGCCAGPRVSCMSGWKAVLCILDSLSNGLNCVGSAMSWRVSQWSSVTTMEGALTEGPPVEMRVNQSL